MKKAIFLDIDGTILDCLGGINNITGRVREAIKRVQAEGNYVFVATGRPYAFISQALLDFGFDGFILANGAQVIINDKVIYDEFIEQDYMINLINELEKHKIQYMLEGAYYSYLKKEFKEFYNYYDKVGISKKLIREEFNINDIFIHKIELLCLNEESKKECLSLISGNPKYDYFCSIREDVFELYMKDNTKAHGIIKALDYLNIPLENSYAFGDGTNDIEMLQAVGCGIAMGNASDEVKGYADKITDTVHNDGVAVGIEEFVLC